MRRSRFRGRFPDTPLADAARTSLPSESNAAEDRLLTDDLEGRTRSVERSRRLSTEESHLPEPRTGIDRRIEELERSHADLVDAVTSLRREVLNLGDRLDEARYDSKLEAALEEGPERDAEYERLVRRLREIVRSAVPREGSVLVVCKGDDELLDLYGRRAEHFPQDETGAFPGYYPSASTPAIIQLEGLRARGSDFLLIPRPAFWWLDHYVAFHAHLESRYDVVVRDDDVCVIYDLRQPRPPDAVALIREAIQEYKSRFDRDPVILDWDSGLDLASVLPEHMVFRPPTEDPTLPYIDASVDLVIVADERMTSEARRVASGAVVFVGTGDAVAGLP
jgi:hypothetical protein